MCFSGARARSGARASSVRGVGEKECRVRRSVGAWGGKGEVARVSWPQSLMLLGEGVGGERMEWRVGRRAGRAEVGKK